MKTVNWKVYGEALDALQAQFSAEDGIQIHNCNFARQGYSGEDGCPVGVFWDEASGGYYSVRNSACTGSAGGCDLRVQRLCGGLRRG